MAESDGIESNMIIVDFADQIDAELSEGFAWRYQPGCGIVLDMCVPNRLSDILLSAPGRNRYPA